MKKTILGAGGLSLLLLFGSPSTLLAHEGHNHGDRYSNSRDWEDTGRPTSQPEDDGWQDEDAYEEGESDRPSSRYYPPPEEEQSSPRERSGRPWD